MTEGCPSLYLMVSAMACSKNRDTVQVREEREEWKKHRIEIE